MDGAFSKQRPFSLEKFGPISDPVRAAIATELLGRAEQSEAEAESEVVGEAMYQAQEKLKKAQTAEEDYGARSAFKEAVESMLSHGAISEEELGELITYTRGYVGK